MHEKKPSRFKSILRFAEEKGFYIILGLCVVAIGVSGYVLFFTGDSGTVPVIDPITLEDTQPTTAVIQLEPKPTKPAAVTEPEPAEAVAPVPPEVPELEPREASTQPPADSTPVSNPVKVALSGYVRPVGGEVIKEFSGQEPVFNETMEDWRVHEGVDLACEEGTPVLALTAGVVTGIDYDELSGHFVSITHSDGLVSTYFGLSSNTTMKLDQNVEAGQEIGTVGNTMLAEIAQPCHLHLVVTKGGEHIDPLTIIE